MQPITDQNLKGTMMKKIILPTLFFLFSFLLISCGEISISESNELSDSDHVIKWFDCLNGDEMLVPYLILGNCSLHDDRLFTCLS